MKKLPRGRRSLAPSILLRGVLVPGALTLALAGCATQDDEAAPVSIFATEAGDCFTTDEDHTAAFIVPCEEPHLYEVSEVHPLDEESFPGDEALQALADETCPEAFATYTGEVPAASTDWASMAFAPSEEGWDEQDDRSVICVVTSVYGEPESGSAKGVAS